MQITFIKWAGTYLMSHQDKVIKAYIFFVRKCCVHKEKNHVKYLMARREGS